MTIDQTGQLQELSLEDAENVSGGFFWVMGMAVPFIMGSSAGFGVAVAQDQSSKANKRHNGEANKYTSDDFTRDWHKMWKSASKNHNVQGLESRYHPGGGVSPR